MHEMPRYKCRKEVWALKIARISLNETNTGAVITPAEPGYASFEVDTTFMSRHRPEAGGYYVLYQDGYNSFLPAQTFESGYTRLE